MVYIYMVCIYISYFTNQNHKDQTLFKFICKKNFCHKFSFLTDSLNSSSPLSPTSTP